LTEEQREQLKQDQTDWFEKRDIDCKVLAQSLPMKFLKRKGNLSKTIGLLGSGFERSKYRNAIHQMF
jgi:hypothetical protein